MKSPSKPLYDNILTLLRPLQIEGSDPFQIVTRKHPFPQNCVNCNAFLDSSDDFPHYKPDFTGC